MTAPDSTPDSRTTVTAGQAAPGMTWEAWYLADGNSRTLAQDYSESKRDAMRRAFHAGAIAAAAPAPAADGGSLLDWAAIIITAAPEEADVLSAPWRSEQQDWLSAYNATPRQPQAAPDLTARLAAVTALLDASHKRDWDSGLASEQARVAEERAGLGMEPLT